MRYLRWQQIEVSDFLVHSARCDVIGETKRRLWDNVIKPGPHRTPSFDQFAEYPIFSQCEGYNQFTTRIEFTQGIEPDSVEPCEATSAPEAMEDE
ncbi:MAG: hypothetical protein ACYTEQ_19665 [Planctomycetota bacterium]|jgi:hypothetical protein